MLKVENDLTWLFDLHAESQENTVSCEFTAIFKLLFKIPAIGRYTRFQWEHTLAQVDKETEYLLQDVG